METLQAIADIQIGYTARGRLEPMAGGVRAIQLRDTTPDGRSAGAPADQFRLDDVPSRYWARSGDIVFRSRGDRNTATLLGKEFDDPAVVVMPLVIIRPSQSVLAEYLAWYINEPPAQRHFDKSARGTGIRMIPIADLAGLEIPVPPIDRQRAIAAAAGLAMREFQLAGQLAEKRRQLIATALFGAARESNHNNSGVNASRVSRLKNGSTS